MRGQTGNRVHMIIVDKHIVIASAKYRSKWWTLTCSCGASRRRKDGSCKHQRDLAALLDPRVARCTRLAPTPMGTNP